MKQRFGLVHRPWGVFYLKDKVTGEQTSLKTKDKVEAQRLLQAKNEAHIQPALNLQIAQAYLSGSDPEMRAKQPQTPVRASSQSEQRTTRTPNSRGSRASGNVQRLVDSVFRNLMNVLACMFDSPRRMIVKSILTKLDLAEFKTM